MTGGSRGRGGVLRLVLASASPRRRALLEAAGLRFEVLPAGVPEEAPPGVDPAALARDLAARKARAAAAALPPGARALVLGADTVVALDGGRILDKPADREEAASHLRSLSGTTHSVITGVCLREEPGGGEEVFHAETRVTMRPLSAEEVAAYAGSGEGLGKAGGYALQENGDRFVTRLEGSRSNVVGLPVEEVLLRLRARGIHP
ncbi:MAG: Maf family protein [Planctomycetes bacterium]|nr:Maf family protein [Planctomycetota bacterium]